MWNPTIRAQGGSGATLAPAIGVRGLHQRPYIFSSGPPSRLTPEPREAPCVSDAILFTPVGSSAPVFDAARSCRRSTVGGVSDILITSTTGNYDPVTTFSSVRSLERSRRQRRHHHALDYERRGALEPANDGRHRLLDHLAPADARHGGSVAWARRRNGGRTDSSGVITGVSQTSYGSGYLAGDTGIVEAVGGAYLAGVAQSDDNLLVVPFDFTVVGDFIGCVPSNSARVISNQFHGEHHPGGDPPMQRWDLTCGGDQITGSDPTNSYVTPGLTLASCAGSKPTASSTTSAGPRFSRRASSQRSRSTSGSTRSRPRVSLGNGFPMRSVGTLQSQTALADPGVKLPEGLALCGPRSPPAIGRGTTTRRPRARTSGRAAPTGSSTRTPTPARTSRT